MFDPNDLREQIARYAKSEISVEELEAWVSAEAWDLEDIPEDARRLAYDVLRLTAEAANGDWDDDALRERLGALGRTYWFQKVPKNLIPPLSGSESMLIRRGQWSAGTDRPLVAEPA
jgi:hypothetical protein